jgi:GH24 family phage-related lysozyme (muramidase)
MAKVDVDVTLPSGEEISVNIPEEWTDAQIRSALVASGDIVDEVYPDAPADVPEVPTGPGTPKAEGVDESDKFLFGLADEIPLVGAAANYVDQLRRSTPDKTVTRKVLRKEGVPEDVPLMPGEEGVEEVEQELFVPGTSKEDIRNLQKSAHEQAMRINFPELMKDADKTRESTAAKWGSGVRLVTDLITAPLPGSQIKALSELASSGTKLLSTQAGRAAIGSAAAQAAKGTAVFSGADNAVRQLAETGELDLEQVGMAALIGGSAGAVLAPVAAAGLGKLLSRMNTKMTSGEPLTAREIVDLAPELDAKQVDDMLAGYAHAADNAKAEQAGRVTMDTNVGAARAQREGARTMTTQQRELARIKAKRAKTDLARRAEGQANSHRLGDDMVELKTNMNAPRNKEGDIKWGFKFGNGVIERLEHIASGFSPAIRKVTEYTNHSTNRDAVRMNAFFDSKGYRKLGRKDKRALKVAMLDSDGVKIREITNKQEGLTDLYENNVRKLIDEIGAESRASGRASGDRSEGFVAGFHPRSIISLSKVRKRMNRKERTALNEALRARTTKKGSPLDESEIENVVRQHLRGGPQGVLKGRRVDQVGDEFVDLYDDVQDSMLGYLHRHHENIATKNFFENSLGIKGVKHGEVPSRSYLAKAMTQAMMRGDLREKDVDEAAMLINSIFGQGRQAPNDFIQGAKSSMTVGAIGNPISTLTQIQDIAQIVDQYGIGNTMVSLFGSKMEDIYSIGLKNFAQATRTPHGLGKVLKGVMDVSGFSAMDNVMANTAINASLRVNMKLAKKNPAKAMKKYQDLGFSADRSRKLVDDLRNRVISEDVRVLNVVEQGKIRPVSIEDLPQFLVDSPNGRVFGTLLTWTAKQINRLRNGALADMRSGHPIRGMRKMITLTGMMGLTGAGVGSIKQFVRGKEITPWDNFTSSALALGMSGKMMVDRLQSGNGQGAMMTMMPFFGIMEQWLAGMVQGAKELDPAEFVSGIGDVRNYKQIAAGPVPKIAAAAVGAGYDSLFGGKDAEKEAVVVTSPERPPPSPDGNNSDLMPPVENMRNNESFDVIKGYENSINAGLQGERWYPHGSLEGGTPTLAYGHKLTGSEAKSGKVTIDGTKVDYTRGLTQEEADALFAQDTAVAREQVMSSVSVPLAQNELVALTSLIFNVGIGNWNKSKAREALNRGDRAEFLYQAYDPVEGFVRMNGKPDGGLIKRRQKEKRIFTGR